MTNAIPFINMNQLWSKSPSAPTLPPKKYSDMKQGGSTSLLLIIPSAVGTDLSGHPALFQLLSVKGSWLYFLYQLGFFLASRIHAGAVTLLFPVGPSSALFLAAFLGYAR